MKAINRERPRGRPRLRPTRGGHRKRPRPESKSYPGCAHTSVAVGLDGAGVDHLPLDLDKLPLLQRLVHPPVPEVGIVAWHINEHHHIMVRINVMNPRPIMHMYGAQSSASAQPLSGNLRVGQGQDMEGGWWMQVRWGMCLLPGIHSSRVPPPSRLGARREGHRCSSTLDLRRGGTAT